MTTTTIVLVASVFVACAVEAVEALTIVLAVGVTRQWRSTMIGVAAALVALAVVVAAVGPAIAALPLNALRLVIGGLLLVFGLQWLRKAILRASGHKARHDETAIYAEQVTAARRVDASRRGFIEDWYAFTVAFKGVLLEGLEVAFIVVTFGANQHAIGPAVLGAVAAVLVVVAAGFAVRHPLARVPENTMKFAVGAMLTTFGMFWGGEGAGVTWPGRDAALLVLLAIVLLVSAAFVGALRSLARRRVAQVVA